MIEACNPTKGGCGGSGLAQIDRQQPCPRCAGLPRVPTHRWPDKTHITQGAWQRGFITPDPDTIIEWCFAHDTAPTNRGCPGARYGPDPLTPCDIAWIPQPESSQRLADIDDLEAGT